MLNIKQELKKYDFLVSAKQISDRVVKVQYPATIFPNKVSALTQTFYFENGAGVKVQYNDNDPYFVEMEGYIHRLFMLTKILQHCRLLNYNKEMIECIDMSSNDISGISYFLEQIPSNPDDRLKENDLAGIYVIGYMNDFPDEYKKQAETSGVLDGYIIMQKVLRGEV